MGDLGRRNLWLAGGFAALLIVGVASTGEGEDRAAATPAATDTVTATVTETATMTVTQTQTVYPSPEVSTETGQPASAPVPLAGTQRAATDAPARSAAGSAPTTAATAVYFANCADARARGAAPLYRGQPGYRAGLDRDNDGVACER